MREFKALSDRFKDAQDWLDYRAALICTIMANVWRDSKTKPFTPEDFMPGKKHTKQTPEQMLAAVQMLNAAYGGKVIEE